MVKDSLKKEPYIGMVLLKKGYEKSYFGDPTIYDIGCLGKVVESTLRDDGKYDIILYGAARFSFKELDKKKSYRIAEAAIIKESGDQNIPNADKKRKLLVDQFHPVLSKMFNYSGIKDALAEMEIGSLIDLITYCSSMDIYSKQWILEEPNAEARLTKLLGICKIRNFDQAIERNYN